MTEPQIQEPIAQDEREIIKVHGEHFTKLPDDLYIPPDALRVFLETFQGPLDLLLYLIKKQNIDILDLPVARITKQYMEYIEVMHDMQLELVAEYLVMAAMLAEIKSRLLLPRPTEGEGEEEGGDPRAELIRRLQEYERFKNAAEDIESLPRCGRDTYVADANKPVMEYKQAFPEVSLDDVLSSLRDVMERARLYSEHSIERESLSIRERMTIVLSGVKPDEFIEISKLFTIEEGRMGVVVTLISILELCRQSLIEITQSQPFAPVYVKARCAVGAEQGEIDYSQLETFSGETHE
jgi:segregation and condensation protein A